MSSILIRVVILEIFELGLLLFEQFLLMFQYYLDYKPVVLDLRYDKSETKAWIVEIQILEIDPNTGKIHKYGSRFTCI